MKYVPFIAAVWLLSGVAVVALLGLAKHLVAARAAAREGVACCDYCGSSSSNMRKHAACIAAWSNDAWPEEAL